MRSPGVASRLLIPTAICTSITRPVGFFDRGLVDASVALRHLTGEPALRVSGVHTAITGAFPGTALAGNLCDDSERRHGLDAGVAEYQRLIDAYPALGYEVTFCQRSA